LVVDNYNEIKTLDQSYLEVVIYSLFKIDLTNFIKTKAILSKEFHIQPSEMEKMPAWEYELFMIYLNEAIKEENDRNKEEMDKAGINDVKKMSNPKNMNRMQQNAMPKMPSMPSINISGIK
jgi:hypothetical protein